MPSPPIQVFLTTIASQPALRQRQEYVLRILQVKKIPFTSYDLASDETAKKLWRRKAPLDKQQLPGILVGGRFPGSFAEFEDAVEHDELDIFLRLKEEWDADLEGERPAPPAQPIGVPGAASPLQMTGQKPSYAPQPSPLAKKVKPSDELDAGEQLEDRSLSGIKVTEDELLQLVSDLGLGGADADDLVKGLSFGDSKPAAGDGDQAASGTAEKAADAAAAAEAVPVTAEAAPTETAAGAEQQKTVEAA